MPVITGRNYRNLDLLPDWATQRGWRRRGRGAKKEKIILKTQARRVTGVLDSESAEQMFTLPAHYSAKYHTLQLAKTKGP